MITTQAGTDGFSSVLRLAAEQLPEAREQPGFQDFYLLTNAEAGKVMTIVRCDTQEHGRAVEAGAATTRDQIAAEAGLTTPHLKTYEVTMLA